MVVMSGHHPNAHHRTAASPGGLPAQAGGALVALVALAGFGLTVAVAGVALLARARPPR